MSPPKAPTFRVPSTPPPFSKSQLKAAIPAHCFVRSNVKSFAYLFADILGVSVLYFLSTYISSTPFFLRFVLWPIYWILQGGVGTGLWVVAHECGHRAFSSSTLICDAVGLVVHSFLTVPYHSWRISHGKHHRSTGDMSKDEVFVPSKVSQLKDASAALQKPNPIFNFVYLVGMFLVGWYGYLMFNISGRDYGSRTSHYEPSSPLFNPRQFWSIVISDIGVALTILGLCVWAYNTSFANVFFVYGVPLLVVNFWLLLYTYLHHTDPAVPHYTSQSWNWLQGALTTVDRNYGTLWNTLHHDIGNTHVLHHLFSTIPHYHAKEASAAIKPILGDYYYENKKSIFASLWEISTTCRYVDDSRPENGALWFVQPTK